MHILFYTIAKPTNFMTLIKLELRNVNYPSICLLLGHIGITGPEMLFAPIL